MKVDRRKFLRQCVHAALGGVSAYSALGNLRIVAAAARHPYAFTDYKALVCIYLYGGNDSFNTIVPVTGAPHTNYLASRGALALTSGLHNLAPVSGGGASDGATYGLHPSMPELATLFNTQRKAAIVANVGTLIYPTTAQQYQDGTVAVPPQLFSHDDQSNYWQTARPDDNNANGWGGRVADFLYSGNPNQQLPMTITLQGENLFQRGAIVNQYNVSAYGVQTLDYPNAYHNDPGAAAMQALFTSGTPVNLFERGYASAVNRSVANYQQVDAALTGGPTLATVFPDTDLGAQLKMVANLIAVRDTLGMKRQVFFVALGGFDTHGDQLATQTQILGDLSQSMKAFYDATVELGVANAVTQFTASDFGRTLSINSDGTDHGWGGHHFAVGGAVNGGKFYGRMPSLLQNGNPDDAGYGQLVPTTSVDQYAAKLAAWFGVTPTDVADIFPNLGRFDSTGLTFI